MHRSIHGTGYIQGKYALKSSTRPQVEMEFVAQTGLARAVLCSSTVEVDIKLQLFNLTIPSFSWNPSKGSSPK